MRKHLLVALLGLALVLNTGKGGPEIDPGPKDGPKGPNVETHEVCERDCK